MKLETKNKILLLSASSCALKICTPNYNYLVSYESLHANYKMKMLLYKHCLLLYKIHNDTCYYRDCFTVTFQQNFNDRNNKFSIFETSNYKIGKSPIARFCFIFYILYFIKSHMSFLKL